MPRYGWIKTGDGRKIFRRLDRGPEPKRSSLPFPHIMGDVMEPTEHVDGKFYTSKSSFRRVTKERGLTEIGNDPTRFRKPKKPDRDKAIEQSIDKAIARARA